MECDLAPDGHQEHEEGVMVFDSYAVINPRTMVIKSLDTTVADGTMS